MTNDVLLQKPDASLAREIAAYRQEFLDAHEHLAGTGGFLSDAVDPLDWLRRCAANERGEDLLEDWVPATQYVLVRQKRQKALGHAADPPPLQ